MSVILVDNAYFGHALRRARCTAKIRRGDAAKMLRITHRKLMKYEHGTRTRDGINTRLYAGTHNILRSADALRP